MAARLLFKLKDECEKQHARAEKLSTDLSESQATEHAAIERLNGCLTLIRFLEVKWRRQFRQGQLDGYSRPALAECADELASLLKTLETP